MAGIGRFYFVIAETVAGLQRLLRGSVTKPVIEFATHGSRRNVNSFTVAAGSTASVYVYSTLGYGFDLLTIEADGYIDVAIKCDKPTSSSNRAALTTHVCWNHVGCSCNAPLVLPGDDVLVADTSANSVDNAFHASNEAGKIYEIQVKNPTGAAASVNLTVTILD